MVEVLSVDQLRSIMQYAQSAKDMGLDDLIIDTVTPRISSMREDRTIGVFTPQIQQKFPFQVMGMARLSVFLKLAAIVPVDECTASVTIHERSGNVERITINHKKGRKTSKIEFRCAKPDTIMAIKARKNPNLVELALDKPEVDRLNEVLKLVPGNNPVLLTLSDGNMGVEVKVDQNDTVTCELDVMVTPIDGYNQPVVVAHRYMRSVLTDLISRTTTGVFLIDRNNIITTNIGCLDAFAIPLQE